ncbi:MAG: transcriptional regulator, family [Anaerocolumna sp.]|nr:transcriptional regulator, family [Anaerocolumna sp.]
MDLYVFTNDDFAKENFKLKNRIKVCRAEKDISQEKLGKDLNLARQTIAVIEQGKQEPTMTIQYKIACYFGKKVEDIFYFERKV